MPTTLDRPAAFNELILADGKAMTAAVLHRLLRGSVRSLSAPFAVFPPLDHSPVPPERLTALVDFLKATFAVERLGHDLVHEVYPGEQEGQWRFLPCLLVYGHTRDDLLRLMADHDISHALVADSTCFLLLHMDGHQERLADRLDPSSAWDAWHEWSRRRHPRGGDLHGLYFPPKTLAAHRALAMDIRRRLDDRYGHEVVEAFMHQIMDGAKPSLAY